MRNCLGGVRRPLVAAALASVIAGCTTADLPGISAFGDNKLEAADLTNIGSYTADRALSEARAHFRNNDFGYSAALYKRVVELSPNDPQGYIGLGASYDRLRRFDLSDRVYAALFKLTGATAQYYNNLGYSYMLRGDAKTALANLQKAKQLDPQNVVVANNLAMLTKVAAKGA
jgi:Flp pilus assembly protein TadD